MKTTAFGVQITIRGGDQAGFSQLLLGLSDFISIVENKGWRFDLAVKDIVSNTPNCFDRQWELSASQTFYFWEEIGRALDSMPLLPDGLYLDNSDGQAIFAAVEERQMELVVLHGYSIPADAHQYVAICPELLDHLWGDWGYQAVLGRFDYWSQMTVEEARQRGVWVQYHPSILDEDDE